METPPQLSPSKLRRKRAAAVNHNLYNSVHVSDCVDAMRKQLAQLTAVVSNLQVMMHGAILQVPLFVPDENAFEMEVWSQLSWEAVPLCGGPGEPFPQVSSEIQPSDVRGGQRSSYSRRIDGVSELAAFA